MLEEERIATHSSILAWEILRTEELGGLQSTGSRRVRNDCAHIYVNIPVITLKSMTYFPLGKFIIRVVFSLNWRRKWQPTLVFLPGESHGRKSLVGYSPRGRKELDTTERLHFLSGFQHFIHHRGHNDVK